MSGIENKAEELGGKAKEAFGEATDNDKLAAEGKSDQVKSEIKQKAEDLGDKAKEVADKVIGSLKKD